MAKARLSHRFSALLTNATEDGEDRGCAEPIDGHAGQVNERSSISSVFPPWLNMTAAEQAAFVTQRSRFHHPVEPPFDPTIPRHVFQHHWVIQSGQAPTQRSSDDATAAEPTTLRVELSPWAQYLLSIQLAIQLPSISYHGSQTTRRNLRSQHSPPPAPPRRTIPAGTELSNLSAMLDDDEPLVPPSAAPTSAANVTTERTDKDILIEHATWTENPGRDLVPEARLLVETVNDQGTSDIATWSTYVALRSEVLSGLNGQWSQFTESLGRCSSADEQHAASQFSQSLKVQLDFDALNHAPFPLEWLMSSHCRSRVWLEIDLAPLTSLVCLQRVLRSESPDQVPVVTQTAMSLDMLSSSVICRATKELLMMDHIRIEAHFRLANDWRLTIPDAVSGPSMVQQRTISSTRAWFPACIDAEVDGSVSHLNIHLDSLGFGMCTDLIFAIRQISARNANRHMHFHGQDGCDGITQFGLSARPRSSASTSSSSSSSAAFYLFPMRPILFARTSDGQSVFGGESAQLPVYSLNVHSLVLGSKHVSYTLHLDLQPDLGPIQIFVWARGWQQCIQKLEHNQIQLDTVLI